MSYSSNAGLNASTLVAEWNERVVVPNIPALLIAATMGSVLFAMFVALIFFSSENIKRKPVFGLNFLALITGMLYSAISIGKSVVALKHPMRDANSAMILATGAFNGITPALVDAILIIRLNSVYPRSRTNRWKRLFIIGTPVLVVIGRVGYTIYILVKDARILRKGSICDLSAVRMLVEADLPPLRLFNNIFCSSLFLYRLYEQGSIFRYRMGSISQQIATLFWISVSNFILPLVISILELVFFYMSHGPAQCYYSIAFSLEQVNFYVSIIGVAFATVWMAERHWQGARRNDTSRSSLEIEGVVHLGLEEKMTFAPNEELSFPMHAVTTTTDSSRTVAVADGSETENCRVPCRNWSPT